MGAVCAELVPSSLLTQNNHQSSAMSEEPDQIVEYRSALRELVKNEKTRITFLTMTAHDNVEYARSIVKCIETHILEASTPEVKLLGIFLIDSIIKNDEKGAYKNAFSTCIIPLFEHVFKSGNEGVRKSLYKVRTTWQEPKEQFPLSRLVGIDMRCSAIDAKWPKLAEQRLAAQSKAATGDQPNATVNSDKPKAPVVSKTPVVNVNKEKAEIEELLKKRNELLEKKAKQTQKASSQPVNEKASTSSADDQANVPPRKKKRRKEEELENINAEFNDNYKIPKKKKTRESKVKFTESTVRRDVDMRKRKKSGDDNDETKPKRNAADSTTNDKDSDSKTPPKLTQTKSDFKPINGDEPKPLIGAPTLGQSVPLELKPTPLQPNFMQPVQAQPPLHIVPNLPANNKVYLDGKPFEVKYINDIAIVEKDSLPHRVHFQGPPKQIFIDGQPHSLSFNAPLEIIIDGTRLPIRFGAPGRELYIGGHPFRAAFGGAAIIATINHRRHEIRISGPPPEVQIEPEPAHELTRFLNGGCAQPAFLTPLYTRANQAPLLPQPSVAPIEPIMRSTITAPVVMPPMVPPHFGGIAQLPNGLPIPPVQELGSLLDKLKSSGVLNMAALVKKQPSPTPTEMPIPPIPALPIGSGLDEEIEREFNAPVTLKSFSNRVLRIRYQAVIDSLYSSQRRCNNCGLRFDNVDNERYSRHLDAHFRDSQRQKREQNSSVSRPWYLAMDDWLVFCTQQSEEEAAQLHTAPVTHNEKEAQPAVIATTEAPVEGKASCKVCEEELEVYWHEDDEKWMLRNAVHHEDGHYYHPSCLVDLTGAAHPADDSIVGSK